MHHAASPPSAPPSPFILVVDDDPEVQAYLELALAVLGWPVVCLQGAPPTPPAVALVDLLLGDQSGLPIIEALRAQGVPVVAISGLGADATPVEAARQAGAVILGKPFGLAELRDTVRGLISARS